MKILQFHEFQVNSSDYFEKCWMKVNSSIDVSLFQTNTSVNYVYSEIESIIAGILYAILSLGGFIMNFLIIVVLLGSRRLRKEYIRPTIVSIAFNNFSYSLYTLPVQSIRYFMRDMPLPTGCQIYGFITYGFWLCSAWNLLGAAVLRFVAVYFPHEKNSKLFRRASKLIPIMAWIVAFVIPLPTLLGIYGQFGFVCRTFGCIFIDINLDGSKADSDPQTMYGMSVVIIGILMMILNVATFKRISKLSKIISKQTKEIDQNMSTRIHKKERKVGKAIGIVTLKFFLVYLMMITLLMSIPNATNTIPVVNLICYLIAGSSVVFNPLVFIICQERYQRAIRRLLQAVLACKSPIPYGSKLPRNRWEFFSASIGSRSSSRRPSTIQQSLWVSRRPSSNTTMTSNRCRALPT